MSYGKIDSRELSHGSPISNSEISTSLVRNGRYTAERGG